VEPRDLSKIVYGHRGEGNYENIERRIPGIFWGKSWIFASAGSRSFGLISVDGPRYFRRFGKPLKLLHFLISVKPEAPHGWLAKTKIGYLALGRHVFHHQLVLAGTTWKKAAMPKRAQQARTTIPVLPGSIIRPLNDFCLKPEPIRLSALYCEGKHVFLRIVNMDDRSNLAQIFFPRPIKTVAACDFLGVPLKMDIKFERHKILATLAPWQIITLKLRCRRTGFSAGAGSGISAGVFPADKSSAK
jgi:hypothetical protein